MVDSNNAKSIFLAAIEMPPSERADFLNEAMGRRRCLARTGRGLTQRA